ncbi:MAG: YgjV family protein [Planctomycetota bacterium]
MDTLLTLATAAPPPALAADPTFLAALLPEWTPGWITRHNALDIGAAITGMVGIWRLGSKHQDGFLWGTASCVFWILFNLRVDSPPGVVFNAVWIVLNVRGLWNWTKDHNAAPDPPAPAATDPSPPRDA